MQYSKIILLLKIALNNFKKAASQFSNLIIPFERKSSGPLSTPTTSQTTRSYRTSTNEIFLQNSLLLNKYQWLGHTLVCYEVEETRVLNNYKTNSFITTFNLQGSHVAIGPEVGIIGSSQRGCGSQPFSHQTLKVCSVNKDI